MKTLEEMRARLGELVKEMRAILDLADRESRGVSTEEDTEWRALEAERVELVATIERREATDAAEAALDASQRSAPTPDPRTDPPKRGTAPAVHTNRGDRPYSLMQLFRAMQNGDLREARIEQRASDEIAERVGDPPQGFYVPYRALMPVGWESRDVTKGTTGAGLVGTDLIPQEFVELLRNQSRVVQAGARMLPNLVGDVDLPSQTAGAAVTWLATETTDLATETTQDFSATVSLTPKTVGIRADVTRRMIKQGTPGIEDLVRDDIRQQIGIAIDLAAIAGSGASGQPQGIIGTAGIGAVALGATPLTTTTWADIVELETDVATANALDGNLAYMMNSAMAGALKQLVVVAGQARFIAEVTNPMGSLARGLTVNGYPDWVTEQVPALKILFGNWREVLIGMWGVLDIFGENVTLGNRGGLVVRGFQDVDVALRHAGSFSLGEV